MYNSAIACYVYNDCPALDLVISIKHGEKFHSPCFSVKCKETCFKSQAMKAMFNMKALLQKDESKKFLVVRLK